MSAAPPSPFSIVVDPDTGVVDIWMGGHWLPDTVDSYAATLGEAIGRLMRRRGSFALRIDCREYPVQTPVVTQRFAEVSAAWPDAGTGPLAGVAIVVGSMLNKLQAQRVFGSRVSVFLDPDAAGGWLVERLAGGPPDPGYPSAATSTA